MRRLIPAALAVLVLCAGAFAAAIAFGGPAAPALVRQVNEPLRSVDFSYLPHPRRDIRARDGTTLVYRLYPPAEGVPLRGSVVLVHGSSARGNSMHALAQAYAAAGWQTYTLDVRGHGDTGRRGAIDYIGQLDDDLEDFMTAAQPPRPVTLTGFSAGGGFALRIAGGPQQALFDQYVLLAPFLSRDAPTWRRDSSGWVSVGQPRLIALALLHRLGLRCFQDLPVKRFALDEVSAPLLTDHYTYALAMNFRPRPDYQADIRAARRPLRVLVGQADDAFHADRFEATFRAAGREVPVQVLPGVDHVGLTVRPDAVAAVVAATGS